MDDRLTISIIIPTFNEIADIDACLASALAQSSPLLEVLVVDGGSTDGTRERVDSYGPPVRLVDNPGRGPASALNVGIAESKGAIICRMDAHTVFDPCYVAESLRVLLEEDAAVAGGPMHPVGTTEFGRAVAAVTSSAVGMPGRFHHAGTRIDTDHVYLGMWKRSTLVEMGGFDAEHFPFVGEDYELSYRITRRGARDLRSRCPFGLHPTPDASRPVAPVQELRVGQGVLPRDASDTSDLATAGTGRAGRLHDHRSVRRAHLETPRRGSGAARSGVRGDRPMGGPPGIV